MRKTRHIFKNRISYYQKPMMLLRTKGSFTSDPVRCGMRQKRRNIPQDAAQQRTVGTTTRQM